MKRNRYREKKKVAAWTDMGFDLSLGGFGFDPTMCMIYVLAVTAVFFAVAVLGIRRS